VQKIRLLICESFATHTTERTAAHGIFVVGTGAQSLKEISSLALPKDQLATCGTVRPNRFLKWKLPATILKNIAFESQEAEGKGRFV